jgi:hypothetical protein
VDIPCNFQQNQPKEMAIGLNGLIKTLVNYLYCAYCALCHLSIRYLFIVVRYLFICAHYYHCRSFILFIVWLFIHSVVRFCSSLIPLLSLFIVHCSQEKNSILILDCIPVISILRTTSSMRVNKHHTADCTDFVLVYIGAKDLLRT